MNKNNKVMRPCQNRFYLSSKAVDEFYILTRTTVYVQSFYKSTDKKACKILTAYFS